MSDGTEMKRRIVSLRSAWESATRAEDCIHEALLEDCNDALADGHSEDEVRTWACLGDGAWEQFLIRFGWKNADPDPADPDWQPR
jgi:hypothetical protein